MTGIAGSLDVLMAGIICPSAEHRYLISYY